MEMFLLSRYLLSTAKWTAIMVRHKTWVFPINKLRHSDCLDFVLAWIVNFKVTRQFSLPRKERNFPVLIICLEHFLHDWNDGMLMSIRINKLSIITSKCDVTRHGWFHVILIFKKNKIKNRVGFVFEGFTDRSSMAKDAVCWINRDDCLYSEQGTFSLPCTKFRQNP